MKLDAPDRNSAFRSLLIERADATDTRRGIRPRHAIAALSAFALAGALTGGAVAGAASARSAFDPQTEVTLEIMTGMLLNWYDLDGSPLTLAAEGQGTLDLGSRPTGSKLVVMIVCTDGTGTFTGTVDGVDVLTTVCGVDGANASGMPVDVSTDGSHSLTVAGNGRFVVWTGWLMLKN